MPERHALVLSLVEHGWRGARECSLILSAREISTLHLIKGSLEREVLAIIEAHPGLRVRDVPRPLFRLALWLVLIGQTLAGRLRWVLVDNDRTLRAVSPWCALCRVVPVLIEPDGNGYRLLVRRRVETVDEVFGR